MDVEKLTQMRDEASNRFDELERQRLSIEKEQEQLRGKFAAYTELISQASDPAKTIKAEGKKSATK
jgi:hypothetical protein